VLLEPIPKEKEFEEAPSTPATTWMGRELESSCAYTGARGDEKSHDKQWRLLGKWKMETASPAPSRLDTWAECQVRLMTAFLLAFGNFGKILG